MNRIFSVLIVPVALFLTTACTDWLDIRPESEIVLEDFWKNESHVNQVLATCYRSLTEHGAMDRMMVWGEMRSDDVWFGNGLPSDMVKILNADISPDNIYCHWGSMYSVINYCNTFLFYAPGVVDLDPNFTPSKLHAMEAEVLTIRALSYFYLVRSFIEVPWVVDPSIDDAQNYRIPASPEDTVLDNIVSDLNFAYTYARDNYEINDYNKGRITKNAVRALLADIYLWREQYQQCIQMCDEILTDTEQDLALLDGEDVLSEVFYKGNSTESIFELQFDDDAMVNWALWSLYGYQGNVTGQWSFPAVLVEGQASPFKYPIGLDTESEEDLREKDFLRKLGDRYYIFKYAGALRRENQETGVSSYVYRSTTPNWIVYRLPDIMLMKAEALIQTGDFAGAVELINLTYMRSNPEAPAELSVDDYNSKIDMDKLLLRERQRELMFEGKRWFDLMRMARREGSPSPLLSYVMKKYSGSATVQSTKMSIMESLYLPIHTDELKANTALEQNPYYELLAEESGNK